MVCGSLLQVLLQDFLAGNVKFLFFGSLAPATTLGRKKGKILDALGSMSANDLHKA